MLIRARPVSYGPFYRGKGGRNAVTAHTYPSERRAVSCREETTKIDLIIYGNGTTVGVHYHKRQRFESSVDITITSLTL